MTLFHCPAFPSSCNLISVSLFPSPGKTTSLTVPYLPRPTFNRIDWTGTTVSVHPMRPTDRPTIWWHAKCPLWLFVAKQNEQQQRIIQLIAKTVDLMIVDWVGGLMSISPSSAALMKMKNAATCDHTERDEAIAVSTPQANHSNSSAHRTMVSNWVSRAKRQTEPVVVINWQI